MKYEDKKIVGVLSNQIDVSVALNVIGHLAISIGKYSEDEIMGQKYIIDQNGITHLGISQFPFIITKVNPGKLKSAIEKARQNPNILVCDYPKEMLETRTDEELVEAMECQKDFEYYGAIFYGNTNEIDEITGKFSLWR